MPKPLGNLIRGGLNAVGSHAVAGAQLGRNKDANRRAARSTAALREDATKVAYDAGGFCANVAGPAYQAGAHAISSGALDAANRVTGGQVPQLQHARDDQARRAQHAAQNCEAGLARATNKKEAWFKQGPGNPGAWMAYLPNEALLTDLYLPGTHDSGARHGGDFAECQVWSIKDQLKAGIRCFDIRLSQQGDALAVCHGPIFQQNHFPNVVWDFEEFLTLNPSEVILARISGNGCSHNSPHDFKKHVRAQLRSPAVWGNMAADLSKTPLGLLRGSVVCFHDDFNTSETDVQDDWELGNADTKFQRVWSHSQEERERGTLYVNYLSSQGKDGMGYSTPSGMAYQVNRGAYNSMGHFRPSVYMMDYPGSPLIERMIQMNWR